MLYAIISEDVANSLPLRKQARADHLARLESLKEQGRLILAGPHPAIDRIAGRGRIPVPGSGPAMG